MDTKKKRTPNQKKKAIVSVLLMVAILITGAFAFLSATDSKTNVFTVGNVKIKLSEEFDTNQNGSIEKTNDENDEVYDASETQVSLKGEILPGQKVIKRPYVENTGKNKAWVYITVGIPTTNSDNTFRNKDTGETSITGQNVDIPIQAYAIQENYANKTTYKDVWNAYFADKVTDTFGAEVTDAKTLSERVPLFEILNKTRFNEPIPDNISVDDNIPNDDWENIGITVDGQEKSYYKSANYDYYVFAYKALLDPTVDGAEQLNRTSDVFEGVRLLKDIGEAQPSKLSYYIKETAGNTLNGEVDLSVETSTYDGYRLVKTEYYMPGERVRNLYYDDTLAETGYSFNWNFMNDKTKSAYSGMIITEDTDLVATYEDTVSNTPKEPTEVPVIKYSPSGYLGYAIEQNDDGSYYATLIGADETRSDYPEAPTEVLVPNAIKILENSDGTKLLEDGVIMHGSIDNFPGGTQIPVKKIQLAEWQWDSSTMNYAAPEAVALGKIAKKLNVSGTNIEEIKFCGDIYQHNITSGFVLEDIGTLPSSLTTLNEKAFYSCVNLKSCILPNRLVTIGVSAFEGCISLNDISIPDSVININYLAFMGCTNLTSISLGENLSSIAVQSMPEFYSTDSVPTKVYIKDLTAFCKIDSAGFTNWGAGVELYLNNEKIENLIIPNNVKVIKESSFKDMAFKSIVISDSVEKIENYAFSQVWDSPQAHNLTKLELGNNVKTIGEGAFMNRMGYGVTCNLPNSLTTIEDSAFQGSYAKIAFSDTIEKIGANAFQACSFDSNLRLPENLISLGDYALGSSGDYSTQTIHFGKNIKSIGLLTSFSNLSEVTVDEQNTTYTAKDGALYTKDYSELLIYPSKKETTNLVLPEGLKKISNNIFFYSPITSIYIPSSVTEIGENIVNPRTVESIVVNSQNTKYDSRNNCNAIIETATNTLIAGCKNTIIPEGTEKIAMNALSNAEVTIPSSLKEIEPNGLVNSKINLTSLETWLNLEIGQDGISNSGLYGNTLYLNNKLLTNVVIPDGYLTINRQLFYGQTQITKITLPETLKEIQADAFNGCVNLQNVELPNSLEYIEDYAFRNTGLSNVSMPLNIKRFYADAFDDNVQINIPNIVTWCSVERYSYQQHNNQLMHQGIGLKNLNIPEGVTVIQNGFNECQTIVSLDIPTSVTSIVRNAFNACNNLKSITYQGTVSDWAKVECPPGSFASGLTITCTDGTVTTQ